MQRSFEKELQALIDEAVQEERRLVSELDGLRFEQMRVQAQLAAFRTTRSLHQHRDEDGGDAENGARPAFHRSRSCSLWQVRHRLAFRDGR